MWTTSTAVRGERDAKTALPSLTRMAFFCDSCPPGSRPLQIGTDCSQSPGQTECARCPGKTWVWCSTRSAELHKLNRTVSQNCAVGCKLRWLHVPKCGSTFEQVVSRYACDEEGAATGGRLCPRWWKTLGHEPLAPEFWGHAVGTFRHPRARMASYCRRDGVSHILLDRAGMRQCLDTTVRNRHIGIMVRLLVSHIGARTGHAPLPLS